jgi:threonine synthase
MYRCADCAATYGLDETVWRCRCGGLLDLALVADRRFEVDRDTWSLWRYRSMFPVPALSPVTLGEGMTPLVADAPGRWLKLDFLMPTLSFKDRGSTLLVSHAASIGVERVVADSSGNAGTSIAAYAARAGIAADVFVPAATSPKKVAQLGGYGACVHQVAGSRADAADAARDMVESTGAFYASHVYNPLFHQGTKTFAYELWEQLGTLPEVVVVPAGNGTLLLGAAIGFAELVAAGLAPVVPRLVAVQAARCAPVAATWAGGPPAEAGETVAEGIAIDRPARAAQMVAAVRTSGGVVVTVGEEEILAARRELLTRGIDVEPTAAAAWAGWRAWSRPERPGGQVVIALSGAGLKAPLT